MFGGSGALGSACVEELQRTGVETVCVSHAASASGPAISAARANWANKLPTGLFDQVVWAQGKNAAGGIEDCSVDQLAELLDANVLFIVRTLQDLLGAGVLASPCRLVVISSVWQDTARQEKLAYIVSKSAVAGLVRSLAADLGSRGISVNAVLPGVVDTPMSRASLSAAQIDAFTEDTPQGSLCSAADVARTVRWLASADSAGVNAVSVRVDGGWANVRFV